MPKFHSTISRRDFMKALGLAGAGLGATAAFAPSFVDLDDATSAGAIAKPWFQKELEFETLARAEIDWNVLQRTDRATQKWVFNSNEVDREEYVKKREPGYKGVSLRDYARTGASS
ncbi:twin-arginine translocation signal domain-containing protein, partial [Dehalogenimonas sp. THU2]|uniref:twin-arginine translocation signal domain-containing protein n=1 Tax=Dehalogenimonas sp. THU2 TaxID=3151121 RepID=UPI0032182046